MVSRFFLYSFCAHAVLLAAAYFWANKWPRTLYVPPVQVTQGEVFVGASLPAASAPPAPEVKPPPPADAAPAAIAAPVADPPSAVGGQQFGAPDGEAKLNNGITIFYPPMSVRLGESGRVTIALEVSATGAPSQARLLKSSGYPRLDQEALQVLGTARFSPAIKGGQAVAAHKEITVEFRLNRHGEPENIQIVP